MVDIGKSINAALLPAVILIALGIVSNVIGAIPILNFLLCIIGIPLFIVNLAILGWSGFRAVKKYGMDLVGGAITGALAGGVSGFVNGIIGLILTMLGIGAGAAMGGGDLGGLAMGAGFELIAGIISIVVGLIFGLILGAILGAAGAFVAQKK